MITIEVETDPDFPKTTFVTLASGAMSLKTSTHERAGLWSADLAPSDCPASDLLRLRSFLNHPLVLGTLRQDDAAERLTAARYLGIGKRAHRRRPRAQLLRFCTIRMLFIVG